MQSFHTMPSYELEGCEDRITAHKLRLTGFAARDHQKAAQD